MATSTRRLGWWMAALGLPWCIAGCSYGSKVWVERTDTLTVPAASVQNLNIETHNGGVELQGEEGRADISVTARVRGGGRTRESAEACLDALELVSESTADGGHRLTSRWAKPKAADWQEGVSFKVIAPARLALTVETHNGAVEVDGVQGDCRLISHNGAIKAMHVASQLVVETHNGAITASTAGKAVDLKTHNGAVHLDATACAQLGGQIISSNGGITLEVGTQTASALACSTSNGGVHCSADLKNAQASRTSLSGQLGEGGPQLTVQTHNGGIRIKQP